MCCSLLVLLALPQEPAFVVHNPAGAMAREERVHVSMPWPRGKYRELHRVRVDGDLAPAETLIRWPDGTVAVSRLHPVVRLGAGEEKRYVVTPLPGPEPAALPELRWYLGAPPALHCELEDPWGRRYRCALAPDPAVGPGGWLHRGQATRLRRLRGRLCHGEHAFLGVTAWLRTHAGERRAELTLLLDNGAHDPAIVLGPVRFASFALEVKDPCLRFRPRLAQEDGLGLPVRIGDAGWRQVLLGPSDRLYLGDRTAKAWRFDLFLDGADATAEERAAAALGAAQPLCPLPDCDWTRHTGAYHAHGGPAPAPAAVAAHEVDMYLRWLHGVGHGPFAGRGDPPDAAADGSPRNGPAALHNVLRLRSARLLAAADAMVLQQTLRPTAGARVRLPPATKDLRSGMSPRTMGRPHGFTALDYEHFSVDLLYDFYWLTGDPLARAELRRAGAGLRALLEDLPFLTSRGEGWCLQAAVLIARATDDAALLETIDRRFVTKVAPTLGQGAAPYVLRQPAHPDALGADVPFDCPWQMSAFVHGVHAMWRQTGADRYAQAGIRAARVMGGAGWLEGTGPKYLLSAADEGRYRMPVGHGPLEGTAPMLTGGFVLAREMAAEEQDQEHFRRRAAAILHPYRATEAEETARNRWFQLFLDRESRER